MIIAIQPDDYSSRSSARWSVLLEQAGFRVRFVDVYSADILAQLQGCRGFMWRWAHYRGMRRIAQRLLPVLENTLGMTVYPDQRTCWHYDDKISQCFLLEAAGIPIPRTWVWFDEEKALNWLSTAKYPLVLKLFAGAGSCNVRLVESNEDAASWVRVLFNEGVLGLADSSQQSFAKEGTRSDNDGWPTAPWNWRQRLRACAKAILKGRPLGMPPDTRPVLPPGYEEHHRGYVLFQEFLSGNPFDTRVTVIGNRAFTFRRFNRAGDFRASGSGRIDHDPAAIDERMIRLGFLVSQRLGTQSIAVDGLYRDDCCVVGEISYTYDSGAVHCCPGHWTLIGDPNTGELSWQSGQMWPEEAQISDFVSRLKSLSHS